MPTRERCLHNSLPQALCGLPSLVSDGNRVAGTHRGHAITDLPGLRHHRAAAPRRGPLQALRRPLAVCPFRHSQVISRSACGTRQTRFVSLRPFSLVDGHSLTDLSIERERGLHDFACDDDGCLPNEEVRVIKEVGFRQLSQEVLPSAQIAFRKIGVQGRLGGKLCQVA